jgi:hypothetical protein
LQFADALSTRFAREPGRLPLSKTLRVQALPLRKIAYAKEST